MNYFQSTKYLESDVNEKSVALMVSGNLLSDDLLKLSPNLSLFLKGPELVNVGGYRLHLPTNSHNQCWIYA